MDTPSNAIVLLDATGESASTLLSFSPIPACSSDSHGRMATALRRRYGFMPPDQAVDFLIIGAGVVGVAIARQLSLSIADKSTFLVERCGRSTQCGFLSVCSAHDMAASQTLASWSRDKVR